SRWSTARPSRAPPRWPASRPTCSCGVRGAANGAGRPAMRPGRPTHRRGEQPRRYDGRVDADTLHSFDVVVVGSAASGGGAAKRFAEAGLRVAVLEAGRQLTDADYREHVP